VSTYDYSGLNQHDDSVGSPVTPFDPLRLCIFTTIAVIAAVLGPIAVLAFAGIAIGGYTKARRAGLLRSRCKLGATRNVLIYLWVIAVLAAAAIPFWIAFWLSQWG